jgi:hypothetical protein
MELELLFLFFNSFSLTNLPIVMFEDNLTGFTSLSGCQFNLTPFGVKVGAECLLVFILQKYK